MSVPRYFTNPYGDEVPGEVPIDIDSQFWSAVKQVIDAPVPRSADLYTGSAGMGCGLYHVAKNPRWSGQKNQLLTKAWSFVKTAISGTDKHMGPGFLTGESGVIATAAVLSKALGDDLHSKHHLQQYLDLWDRAVNADCDELFTGRAGYLAGYMWMCRELGVPVKKEKVFKLCDKIVESGQDYAKHMGTPSPLAYAYHGKQYLGAAHGISFILLTLMRSEGYLDAHPDTDKLVRSAVDWILGMQDKSGQFPSSVESIGRPLVHWCHGAGGIIYLIVQSYQRWKDVKYLHSAEKCAQGIWNKGLLRKGPGLCHGISGNGYAFLQMYQITKDPKYLRMAEVFANFMTTPEFSHEARTPDRPLSLFEGLAGTSCFLSDLSAPESAEFPFCWSHA